MNELFLSQSKRTKKPFTETWPRKRPDKESVLNFVCGIQYINNDTTAMPARKTARTTEYITINKIIRQRVAQTFRL